MLSKRKTTCTATACDLCGVDVTTNGAGGDIGCFSLPLAIVQKLFLFLCFVYQTINDVHYDDDDDEEVAILIWEHVYRFADIFNGTKRRNGTKRPNICEMFQISQLGGRVAG